MKRNLIVITIAAMVLFAVEAKAQMVFPVYTVAGQQQQQQQVDPSTVIQQQLLQQAYVDITTPGTDSNNTLLTAYTNALVTSMTTPAPLTQAQQYQQLVQNAQYNYALNHLNDKNVQEHMGNMLESQYQTMETVSNMQNAEVVNQQYGSYLANVVCNPMTNSMTNPKCRNIDIMRFQQNQAVMDQAYMVQDAAVFGIGLQ